jgi:2-iminobutanoate/2-iminopropanoate deaminase
MSVEETLLLTVVLRHDQSKNLEELQDRLGAFSYWKHFPPAGAEIVSWNVVMGIGQIVTLRLPPHLLAAVNVALERSAWGAFTTEFYPTYDFVPVRERLKREWQAKQDGGA